LLYLLSLHDALPIFELECRVELLAFLIRGLGDWLEPALDVGVLAASAGLLLVRELELGLAGRRLAVADLRSADFQLDLVFAANADRKSTRLNSSHQI